MRGWSSEVRYSSTYLSCFSRQNILFFLVAGQQFSRVRKLVSGHKLKPVLSMISLLE